MSTYFQLKTRHREERDSYSPNLSIRVHRALSWLNKAEQCEDDDAKFIFLWIAFNAAYAQDIDPFQQIGEKDRYQNFLSKLVSLDTDKLLSNIVWENYAGRIRVILDNEYILQAYWDFHSGKISEEEWRTARSKAKEAANRALAQGDTTSVLSILFSRLYTLRNQLMHGGATYGSAANRNQLRDCTDILAKLVPIIIALMMDGKSELWGDPKYPLIER